MPGIIFGVFAVIVVIGCPIALAMLLGGAIPSLLSGYPITVITQRMFASTDSFTMLSIPLFILAGGLMDKGGVSKRLVDFANSLVGWLPGGLAVVTFLASALFGAISGSAAATVAAIGSIMIPAMLDAGYPKNFALATTASAGFLGIIIPPSIPMILYCTTVSGVSISDMFVGGIIPGILLAAAMSCYAIIYGKRHLAPTSNFCLREVGRTFVKAIGALGMPIIILGGIYGGVFTPTEAAGVAVLYGLIVSVVFYRMLNLKIIVQILKQSCITTCVVMLLVAAASLFSFIMTSQQITVKLANFMTGIASSQLEIWVLVTILLLLVGTFMETGPAVLILGVVLGSVMAAYDIDLTLFGVVMIVNLGIGMITPPVGLNLFVSAGILHERVDTVICRHLFFYMIFAVLVLILLMVFPGLVTWLPNFMS